MWQRRAAQETAGASAFLLPAALGGLVGAGAVVLLNRRRGRQTNGGTNGEADPAGNAEVADAEVTADDLDKEQLSELHNATLKASDSCFELKKLCATVLVPTGALLALFTNKRLDAAVFGAGLLVIGAFWLADSVGYFYQRKLRAAMTPIWRRRAARCVGGYDHVPDPKPVGPLRAAFNASMLYYLILAALLGTGFLLFELGVIGSSPGGVE